MLMHLLHYYDAVLVVSKIDFGLGVCKVYGVLHSGGLKCTQVSF